MNQQSCFVIMPLSDVDGYEPGHFQRVFDFLIKPACLKAGFSTPILANSINNTNVIILDILKRLVTVDLVICDLSSKNPNVMYELGIRQAFNLPVVLIKDKKTNRVFDISAFRDIEYDESLRIDTIQEAIIGIADNIKNTIEKKDGSINSFIELLAISSATIPNENKISHDTSLILTSIEHIKRYLSDIFQETQTHTEQKVIRLQEQNKEELKKLFTLEYEDFIKALGIHKTGFEKRVNPS